MCLSPPRGNALYASLCGTLSRFLLSLSLRKWYAHSHFLDSFLYLLSLFLSSLSLSSLSLSLLSPGPTLTTCLAHGPSIGVAQSLLSLESSELTDKYISFLSFSLSSFFFSFSLHSCLAQLLLTCSFFLFF